MTIMTVEFGTDNYGEATFSLDDFAKRNSVSSSFEEKAKAYNLLHKTMDDQTFIDDGYRNDDAVNCCIALYVFGFDPVEWFDNFFEDHDINDRFFNCDIEKFMDHVHRVCGYGPAYFTNYLLRWGPVGDEGAALGYVID